jgi:hypothetical protein
MDLFEWICLNEFVRMNLLEWICLNEFVRMNLLEWICLNTYMFIYFVVRFYIHMGK